MLWFRQKADYNAKISDIQAKYFTTFDYDKFRRKNTLRKDKGKIIT